MTCSMVVQWPVAGAFGTDADFDLRAQVEHDLDAALIAEGAGECGRGETDAGRTSIHLEAVTEPDAALRAVTGVLARHNLLHRATVVLETRDEADPDDIDRRTLWPLPPVARVA